MLTKVLYISQLSVNFIFKGILDLKGYKIVKENGLCKISRKNKLLVYENRENKLYIFTAIVKRSNQVLMFNIDKDTAKNSYNSNPRVNMLLKKSVKDLCIITVKNTANI